MSSDQIALISQRLDALTSSRSQSLSTVKSNLSHDVDSISTEVHTQFSHQLNRNREQVMTAVTELSSSIQRNLANDILSMFAAFTESLQDADLEALDISNWVSNTLTLFENHFGVLSIDQNKALEIVNDFNATWNSKVEGLTASNKYLNLPPQSSKQEDNVSRGRESSRDSRDINDIPSSSAGRDASKSRVSEGRSPSASEKKGLFSKIGGLFKAERSQSNATEGPKVVNLGKEKNFRWDPDKKRYIFDDESEGEEEQEDTGPPLMKFASESAIKKVEEQPHSLVKPPEHRALKSKKSGPVTQKEAKRPAFIPSAPTLGAEEHKQASMGRDMMYEGLDVVESIRRRIDEIFYQASHEEVVIKGINRLKRDLKALDDMSGPSVNDEIAREAKFLVMESELESTQISIVRESYSRKLLETELSSLRESYQQSMEKEFELVESVKELERDLNMYKDVYSIKSQVQSTVNASQMQQKVLEQFLQSLKETNAEKRKLIEANNQLRDTELQLQEAKAALKVMQAKYEQVMEYQRTNSGSAGQLKSLLEDSYKAQKEQDRLIIQLKEENLGLVARCKELFGQIGGLQGDNNGLKGHLGEVEGRVGELEGSLSQAQNQIGELENSLSQAQGQIGELENSLSQAQEQMSDHEIQLKLCSERIKELDDDKGELERRLQEEEDVRRQVEERLQEEENVRTQLEARLQSEEGYRRELEERLQEEEAARGRAQEEIEEYARRLEGVNEEKEVIVRRFEESTEEGRRLKIQLEELSKEVKHAWEQKDQIEREVRREREQMLEELLEHKNKNQMSVQEKELMNKFVEEITQGNLSLEERVQGLNNEVNRLNTEKHKSIEAILQFITEMKNVISDTSDLQTLEEYVTGLLGGRVDISQHYFRAVGVLPKIRDAIIRELDAEKTRKNLEIENLSTQLGNIEKERILSEDQQRALMEECQRLGGLIEANNEQTQQYEVKFQEMAAETERLRAEIEGYNQQNIHLQRALQQKELELGENLRAFEDHQQQQNVTLQNFEAQIRQLNDLKEEMWKIQAGQEEERARGAQAHLIKVELEEQVSRLKEENVDLQQQIDEGFEQYTFLQSKAKELMGQLKQAKDENAQLRNEHQELEQTNRKMSSQLETQVTTETSIIQQQATTIESFETERAGMVQEIAALRERVDILSQELVNKEGVPSEVQILSERIQALDQLLQAREADLAEKDARISELVANNTLLASLQEGQQASEGAIQQLMARIEELNKVIAEKDAGIRELEAFRENASANINTLAEEKENALVSLQSVQVERDEVLTALKTLQQAKDEAVSGDVAALNERVQILTQELEASNARSDGATREVEALTGRVNAMTTEVAEKDARINELIANNTLLTSLQEGQQSSETAIQQLMARTEELNKVIVEKDAGIRELEAFREDALVNIKTLTEEKEHVLMSLQAAQVERDEALATVKTMQESEKENITRLDLLQLERDDLLARLQEEETRTYSLNHVLEETHTTKQSIEGIQKEMEWRLNSLEQEKAGLLEERNGAVQERDDLRREVRELNNLLAQKSEEKGVHSIGIDGEELWAEIEREYGGSRIMEYLQSMKAKIGVDSREFTGVKLIGVLLKEFEEAIGDISRGMEDKEATLLGLTRSLDDMNEQYQKLQNHMAMLEGEQSEKEDYSSIRELYEKKTKRVEELLKEISTKNGQIEQMKKSMDEQARMLDENQKRKGSKGSDELESSLKEEVVTLRQEVEKEKEKCNKVTEEFENYKKKQKDTSEERGAIQHSYAQIIKNLSLQLDELKKKKGIPTATLVSKSTQTGEEEPKKSVTSPVVEEGSKRQGFLSGMAKFFLTEAEAKKI